MSSIVVIFVISCTLTCITRGGDPTGENKEYLRFPQNFLLGAASAAYQIEGAWNISDKGESVWDRFVHQGKGRILNDDTGDVACDSYHKYKEDVALLKKIGLKAYRFSISWSRVLPTGFANKVSQEGIVYYKNLVDELLANGIEPMMTIYHWDHPQIIEDAGGWTNPRMVEWYADYARLVFREFGDKVKKFSTLNEPSVYCQMSYADNRHAPGKKSLRGIGEYLCAENQLKAHPRAYEIYQNDFKQSQNGSVGIIVHTNHFYAKIPNDTLSSNVAFQFAAGWILHPIYSENGDYPAVMKKLIRQKSLEQNYPRSRLPELGPEWVKRIRGSSDFIGINHYTSYVVEPGDAEDVPSYLNDQGLIRSKDPTWGDSNSIWLKIAPNGFGDMLRKFAHEYGNPVMYITENGVSDKESIEDPNRIQFYYDYLKEMLIAINRDGINVKGYFLWSFMDNFEWERGYGERFGIVHVNFTDPERLRTMKQSAHWWSQILQSNKLESIQSFNSIDSE